MNKTSSLVLGLGGVGGVVARELRDRLAGGPQARTARFLFLDAPGPDGPPSTLATQGHPIVESIPLSMEVLRDVLAGAQDWADYLPGLPSVERGQMLEELRPYGTAGYRCLGRIALLRSAEVIDRIFRRHLHELQETAPVGFTDGILIAGAGGGLGSSILADLTFLLLRLAATTSRTACLILPPPGEAARHRFQANAFASLCEAFELKTRRSLWENRFETLPPIQVKPFTAEPWQRFYLFQAELDEQPPYRATARRVAEALALQLDPSVAEPRHRISQDWTVLEMRPRGSTPRSDTGFGTCYGRALDLATLTEPPAAEGQGLRGPSIDPYLLDEAARQLVAACETDLLDVRSLLYQKRKPELVEVHRDLAAWEVLLLKAVGELSELREGEGDTAFVLDSQAVMKLPGADRVLRRLWAEVQKPAADLPPELAKPASSPPPPDLLPARQQLADLKELREDAAIIWDRAPKSARKAGEKGPKRRFLFPRLQRNMLWNLSQRVASGQALLHTPELHDGLRCALEEILTGWMTQDQAEAPVHPSLEIWLAEVDRDLVRVAQGVFASTSPQAERRHFALALLPREVPPHVNVRTLQARLEGMCRERLQCSCEVLPSPGGVLRLYYEDLFRSPREIRSIRTFRAAYLEEPVKEVLHSDHRIVESGSCLQLCGEVEQPVSCGNPGCSTDIRATPADVLLCPGCGRPILSRCGNHDCKLRNLHERPEARNRTCPECRGLNHAAWWVCHRHGKADTYVPIDKSTCPECILRHHENPDAFPADCVSVRPDLQGLQSCWRCQDLARANPDHQVFHIPRELLPFVKNGVNGHDRVPFLELAREYKLADDVHCPSCGTVLVPVDHRRQSPQGSYR